MTIPGRVTPRLGTIVALDAGETFEISRAQVKQIRAQYPEVVNAIIEMFSQEVHWLARRLLEVLYVDADKRVRRRLVELQRQYAEGPGGTPIGLTQEDLAGLAGTSRSTVNRVLREEEQRGVNAGLREPLRSWERTADLLPARVPCCPPYRARARAARATADGRYFVTPMSSIITSSW